MAEENKTDDKSGDQTDEFKPITSQEELTKLIGARIDKVKSKYADYADIKAKATEFDKAQEASKTELQKERDRAEAAEKRASSLELNSLRAEVALAKGLSASQAKRLVGSTKEELEADADELLVDLGPSKGGQKADPKNLKSGSAGSAEQLTGKEKAAAALRQMRSGT